MHSPVSLLGPRLGAVVKQDGEYSGCENVPLTTAMSLGWTPAAVR